MDGGTEGDGMTRLAIIGAGISGLTAAYAVEQLQAEGLSAEIDLFEASDRLGGVIQTARYKGLAVEMGPDSLVDRPRGPVELCHRLGLGEQLVGVSATAKPPLMYDGSGFEPYPAVETRSFTLAQGLDQLPKTLAQTLRHTTIHLRHAINECRMSPDGWHLNDVDDPYPALIMALPASRLGPLLRGVPVDTEWVVQIRHQSRAIVAAAYDGDSFSDTSLLQHTGLMVSPDAKLGLTALTWLSSKWAHLSGSGSIICRTFWGATGQNPVDWSDAELRSRHEDILTKLAGPHAPMVWMAVARHENALPQVPSLFKWPYPDSINPEVPYLGFVGPYRIGPGLSDCIAASWEEAYRYADWARQLAMAERS